MIRLSALLVLLAPMSQASVCPSAYAPQKPTVAKAIRAARYEIKQKRYAAALDELKVIPVPEFDADAECLTVRAVAQWCEALRLYGNTSVAAGDYGILRQVEGQLRNHTDKFARTPEVAKQYAEMKQIAAAEIARCKASVETLPAKYEEVEALFRRAGADFDAAARLPKSGKEWCDNIEGLQILSKGQLFVLWQERERWEKRAALSAGGFAPSTGKPTALQASLEKLEHEVCADIGRAIDRKDGAAPTPALVHSAADALLLVSLSAGRMKGPVEQVSLFRVRRTMERLKVTSPRVQAESPSESLSPSASWNTIAEALPKNPSSVLRLLYEKCSGTPYGARNLGPAYARYFFDLSDNPEGAPSLVDGLCKVAPSGASWVALEGVEAMLTTERSDDEIVRQLALSVSDGAFDRPILTSAPAPVRDAFLHSPLTLLMELGPAISGDYREVTRLIRRATANAADARGRANHLDLRLRFGAMLTKSSLPWDRWKGYSEAREALDGLAKLEGVLSAAERSAYAAIEARLGRAAASEGYPARSYQITGGKALWVRDPMTQGSTVNFGPSIYVGSGGGFVIGD